MDGKTSSFEALRHVCGQAVVHRANFFISRLTHIPVRHQIAEEVGL